MSVSVWYSYLYVVVYGIVTCMSVSVWYSYLYVSQCMV